MNLSNLKNITGTKLAVLAYSALALAILLPLLIPGYIFALDMVFGPAMELPKDITASYPLYVLLWLAQFAVPMDVIQKLLLFIIIVLCGIGAHRLTEYLLQNTGSRHAALGAYFAGILYTINPFTYTRLVEGQFAVVFGYALLPFFVKALFELLYDQQFTFRASIRFALYALLVSIVSIHAVGYLIIISLAAVIIFAAQNRRKRTMLLNAGKYLGLSLILFLALSSYWLAPTLLSDTPREQLIGNFGQGHLLSFRTDGSTDLGVIGNVLTLNGYWGDREDRYTLPRTVMPLWPVLVAILASLVLYGLYVTHRDARTQIILVGAAIGAVLAIGIAAVPFSVVNEWLLAHIPLFQGYREPQKFVSLLALAYAVLGGIGVAFLNQAKPFRNRNGSMWIAAGILVAPLLHTPTFLWGFAGQLHSAHYPTGWSIVNEQYVRQSRGAILFLPWHQYMYFDFADRVILNPAPRFFKGDIIAGDNAEIGLIDRQVTDNKTEAIEKALSAGATRNLGEHLAALNVEYVLLSKNADWQDYAYLDAHADLTLLKDLPTLKVYKNNIFYVRD